MNEHVAVKPCVHIRLVVHPGWEEKLREVQAGLEEEGIPWRVKEEAGGAFVSLGHQAATESQLGVGVGIDAEGMCIHYQKLPQDKPLFLLNADETKAKWRRIGYNAARLVKGIPFKEEETTMNDDTWQAAVLPEENELAQLVARIVGQVIAETGKAMGR